MNKLFTLTTTTLLLLSSCGSNSSSQKTGQMLFQRIAQQDSHIDFVNEVHDGEDFNVLTYRNFYNGGGVAIGDVNNDGLADIYFTANQGPNKLYLNRGNWQFEDVTDNAGVAGKGGWSTGVAMADVNADGWLDIYVCNSGDIADDDKTNELFINHGPSENGDVPSFSEAAKEFGLDDPGYTTHASFFDYDLDGDLDCYILNNSYKNPEKIDAFTTNRQQKDPFGGDKLFRNDQGHFTNVTEAAGIYSSPIGFGLGVSVSDLNDDGWPDIYISNDFWERDYLYINDGNGTFREELPQRLSLCSVSSMGADIADFNNDGTFDVFTTDMLPADNHRLKTTTVFDPYHLEDYKYRADYHYQILQNCLQLNDGQARFQELSQLSGVAATDWSWGALAFDFDNNGWKDIFVCNALFHEIMYLDFTNFINDKEEVKKVVTQKGRFDWRDFAEFLPSNPLPNYAFVNGLDEKKVEGKLWNIPQFTNKAAELGLGEASFSNGSAYGDLDNDGDLDLVVNNVNMSAFVYRNTSSEQQNAHFLKLKFEGPQGNPFGVGARAEISVAGHRQVLQQFPQRGFQSSVEPGLLFGLGDATLVDTLWVVWPGGLMQQLTGLATDKTLTLKISDATGQYQPQRTANSPIFQTATAEVLKGNTRHKENRFNDFDHEVLLHRMLSTEGPKIIRGDLTGDGLEDFVLAGAAGDPDKLFIQTKSGQFGEVKGWLPEADKEFETTCGVIFDADGDGDNDLMLGSGGNDLSKGIELHKVRYYNNDGGGRLRNIPEMAPPAAGMFSCMVTGDIDLDGDLDLFIGGRAVPGNYGLQPRSFLLLNEKLGRWVDVTRPEMGNCGMVTGAAFSDTDNDGDLDLVVIGDWSAVLHFESDQGRFVFSKKQTAKPHYGWWTGIQPADLDGDGDVDFVLGNWGLNTKFQASETKPLSLFVKDFDQNGKSEFVLNWYPPLDDKPWPFASKMDMTTQVSSLKKKALKFEDYSHLNYETMFDEAQRKGALAYRTTWLQSAIMWNEKDSFRLEALPLEAQVAPVFGIAVYDFNSDGLLDIWLGGNFYGLKPEVGHCDSSRGVLLIDDGTGKFKYLTPAQAGIYLTGQVRDAAIFQTARGTGLLITRNNDEAVYYEVKGQNGS